MAAPTHNTLSATPTAPLPLKRAMEYDLDQHGLYSLRDFQPFLSKTYHGTCVHKCVVDISNGMVDMYSDSIGNEHWLYVVLSENPKY